MNLNLWTRYPLLRKSILVVFIVILIKLVMHSLGYEVISLNPLFSGLVAANVFIMGFLLSGILTDYKESERLPGELAASLETLTDEVLAAWQKKQLNGGKDCLMRIQTLAISIQSWFYKQKRTQDIMDQLTGFNHSFNEFESNIPANYIVRMKQEQSTIRRLLIRIHTIRETNFISAGYLISRIMTILLTIGLILSKIDPFYESLFFVGMITFLFCYLSMLIEDLDNPFGYYDSNSDADVSLKPLEDTISRLGRVLAE